MPEVMSIEVDEEFDPRPAKAPMGIRDPEGNLNIPLIGGIVLAVLLILAIIVVLVNPFKKEEAIVVTDWKPNDPTLQLDVLESYPVTDPIVKAVQASLDSWAAYNLNGDVKGLALTFDLAGDMYADLSGKAADTAANPDPGPQAVVVLGPLGNVSRVDNVFTVRTTVNWTVPGTSGNDFNWDIVMINRGGRYLLSKVIETDPLAKKPISFCVAADLIASLDTGEKVTQEYAKQPPAEQVKILREVFEIRLKTWSLLYQVVQGQDDGAAIKAIVDENKTAVDSARKATTTAEVFKNIRSTDISTQRAQIESRVRSQCNVDVTDR